MKFSDHPDVVLRGYGRSRYTGKDYIRADKTSKKFSIACARKDMFSRLIICILVEKGDDNEFNQMNQMKMEEDEKEISKIKEEKIEKEEKREIWRMRAIPTCLEIGKQDENGLNGLFIQNYDEDDEEMNRTVRKDFRGDIYEMNKSNGKEMEENDEDLDFLELLEDL